MLFVCEMKRCCRISKYGYLVRIKYIIIYNVSIDYKYLNINMLARDTPKSQGIKNHIHSSSEFFIFLFYILRLAYVLTPCLIINQSVLY